MPEMPEVEQVRKTLVPHITGKRILGVEVRLPRLIVHPDAEAFSRELEGRRFDRVERQGKYLLLRLDSGRTLMVHLRITGALVACPKEGPEPPYAKVRFGLEGEEDLWFTDIRTFGTLCLLGGDDPYINTGLATLGPEPLSEGFTPEYLRKIAARSSQAVKSFILDQRKIAGLGNIYADEALFKARIHPLRPARLLKKEETERLWEAVNAVIAQGLENRGTSFRNYQDANGEMGNNQNHLQVYQRKGQPCRACGETLVQIKVGGRGSVYCPACQKPPRKRRKTATGARKTKDKGATAR